jgi:hypothetical protein
LWLPLVRCVQQCSASEGKNEHAQYPVTRCTPSSMRNRGRRGHGCCRHCKLSCTAGLAPAFCTRHTAECSDSEQTALSSGPRSKLADPQTGIRIVSLPYAHLYDIAATYSTPSADRLHLARLLRVRSLADLSWSTCRRRQALTLRPALSSSRCACIATHERTSFQIARQTRASSRTGTGTPLLALFAV